MEYAFTASHARERDQRDPVAAFRQKFHIPRHEGKDVLYFTGNSLGLPPKKAREFLEEEFEDWARWGVKGHTHSRRPWVRYHEFFASALAHLTGAKAEEVVAMGGLTQNLHLLLVSFFRPTAQRTKILCEAKAFPSDQYALRSQLRFQGLDPDEHLIEVAPEKGRHTITTEQFTEAIHRHRDQLALVMIGGVNYYSGQYFDLARITEAGHEAGAFVGWDLAHAAGNVELKLHQWEVDFAVWCGYKYLNSGPGGVSGVFIHEKHHGQRDIPRFEGWWGHNKASRFQMPDQFDPIPTAEAWQLSNAPVFSMAPLLASLKHFEKAGWPTLRQKSEQLTAYLAYVLREVGRNVQTPLEIITPENPEERGCQLSVVVPGLGRKTFDQLTDRGVVADWREPDVIRLAPVPLYNRYEDVWQLGQHLLEVLNAPLNH